MKFFKEFSIAVMIFFIVGILLNIGTDLYTGTSIFISITDILEILIVGILSALVMLALSSKWKNHYENKKPQN